MTDADGQRVRDDHGQFIVRHDLFNHEGKTEDGIAEAFQQFAAKERLILGLDELNSSSLVISAASIALLTGSGAAFGRKCINWLSANTDAPIPKNIFRQPLALNFFLASPTSVTPFHSQPNNIGRINIPNWDIPKEVLAIGHVPSAFF